MADGDYERGRDREIAALAARLKRLRQARGALVPRVLVFNGWASSPQAWDLCTFARARLFSYVDQLAGEPEAYLAAHAPARFVFVGWSMGGSTALRLACRFPDRVAGLVLLAATPRMMADPETDWKGMTARRLSALEYGLRATQGAGFFGAPEGVPNPYMMDTDENLAAGLAYLRETDLRAALSSGAPRCGAYVFQSARDGIVRAENAAFLSRVFPQAVTEILPGAEHALPVTIPEKIDAAVAALLRAAISS